MMQNLNKNNFVRWQGNFNTGDQCALVVSVITINKSGEGFGFNAFFALNNGTADHYTLEIDDGNGYQMQVFAPISGGLHYNHADSTHTIRITPYCSPSQAGTPGTGTYNGCTPVSMQPFTLPDATVNHLYSFDIALSGTQPYAVTPATQDWVHYTINASTLTVSGTPTQAGSQAVDFTVSNACGSEDFQNAISVVYGGAEIHFQNTGGDADYDYETGLLTGNPGATLTIKVTQYTNNNGGTLTADGTQVYQDYTFTKTLDGSGNATFAAVIHGDHTNTNSAILGQFQIIATSAGTISGSNTAIISKVF